MDGIFYHFCNDDDDDDDDNNNDITMIKPWW